MRLIIDANRLISAILRDGSTRRALIQTKSTLHAPDLLLEEISRHRARLADRSGIRADQFDALVTLLVQRVQWVTQAEFDPFLPAAQAALGRIDPNDVFYLAAALAIGADAIWSEDVHFDRQDLVPRTRHPDKIER